MEKKLWKTSEVCKMTGVSRRTLQEYDKFGLLKPTKKIPCETSQNLNKNKVWLYDKYTIDKLMLIQIFVEAGYNRKTIKDLLESPTLDLADEFDQILNEMEKKRKRIDGFINMIKLEKLSIKLIARFPESVAQALTLDMIHVYKTKSFSSYLEDTIVQAAEFKEVDSANIELVMPFIYDLLAFAILNSIGVLEDAKDVQTVAELIYNDLIEILKRNEDDSEKDLSNESMTEVELSEYFLRKMRDIVNDPEFFPMFISDVIQRFGPLCGDGITEYILRAVQIFCNKKSMHKKCGHSHAKRR